MLLIHNNLRRVKIMNRISSKHLIFVCCFAFMLASCQPNSNELEPSICYVPPMRFVEETPSAFDPLSRAEKAEDWGKEVIIADTFAREMDLYRAITGYKRAEILLPSSYVERRLQIEYNIILCYYLGCRYIDAIEIFECSDLTKLSCSFPGFSNVLIMMYDCYQKVEREDKAEAILKMIEKFSPETACELKLYTGFVEGDLDCVEMISCERSPETAMNLFLEEYHCQAKSVRKAQILNAVLPGAGYYYVGQKKAALTSFVINTLFTAAAYQFFNRGYIAAGLITTSIELGWYFGGINGAGLAAKAYNERFYSDMGKEALMKDRLFPILMFETAF